MIKRFATYFAGVGIVLSAALSLTALSSSVSAVVDNDPDCDNVAIIRCGAFDANTMRSKASQGDVPKIYNAFGISQNDLKGEYVNGIVWRDGRVTVGDRVVATGAMTAGRNFGGTPIAGTNAGKYPTSKFVTEGQTAFVRMVDGKFSFAIIKACGNPVTGTPKQPELKPEYKCVSLKAEPVGNSRYKYRFTANATASGGAIIEKYEFGFGDGYGITVSEKSYTYEYKKTGTFKTNVVVHVKVDGKVKKITSPACEKTITIKEDKIKVCELATKTVIRINPSEFDSTKHSRDLNDCKETPNPATIKVCDLDSKQVIEIKDNEFDETKHSKDLNDCEEVPEVLPAEIAKGGPGALAASLFGSSALGYGAFSYFQSRRNLLDKLLGR
ncbi:TPA: hypothetical protein DCF80_02355 [Candidatus Saccharibacteria bacterium]|mgnify:FL=1|nr:hypothetical protein [Candidatus Saccharibacteria bacterium]HRK40723.1 PKD domain-containing protein [Candidatus Saccharibacteria bacterium]